MILKIKNKLLFRIIPLIFVFNACSSNNNTALEAWKRSYAVVEAELIKEDYVTGSTLFLEETKNNTQLHLAVIKSGINSLIETKQQDKISSFLADCKNEVQQNICQTFWKKHFSKDEKWIEICTQIPSPNTAGIDSSLVKELAIILINDQFCRGKESSRKNLEKETGLNVDEHLYYPKGHQFYQHGIYSDSINRVKLKAIINKHGFPTKTLVGAAGMRTTLWVLQHSDMEKSFREKHLPDIKAAVERGDLPKKLYAYLIDRTKVAKREKQIYGTQFAHVDFEKGIAELAPVENEVELDLRRMQMDLMPIKLYQSFMLKPL